MVRKNYLKKISKICFCFLKERCRSEKGVQDKSKVVPNYWISVMDIHIPYNNDFFFKDGATNQALKVNSILLSLKIETICVLFMLWLYRRMPDDSYMRNQPKSREQPMTIMQLTKRQLNLKDKSLIPLIANISNTFIFLIPSLDNPDFILG